MQPGDSSLVNVPCTNSRYRLSGTGHAVIGTEPGDRKKRGRPRVCIYSCCCRLVQTARIISPIDPRNLEGCNEPTNSIKRHTTKIGFRSSADRKYVSRKTN